MTPKQPFLYDTMKTPLGDAILVADAAGALRMFVWEDVRGGWGDRARRSLGAAELAARRDPFGHTTALTRYFEGEITALDRPRHSRLPLRSHVGRRHDLRPDSSAVEAVHRHFRPSYATLRSVLFARNATFGSGIPTDRSRRIPREASADPFHFRIYTARVG